MMHKQFMKLSPGKSLLTILVGIMFVGTQGLALGLTGDGRVEGRLGLVRSSDGQNNLVHMERVNYGLHQSFNTMNFSYSLYGGGITRGSSELQMSELVPEFQARAQLQPFGTTTLEAFSYSQLRNPMQIVHDSLQHRETVSGVQFRSELPNDGRLLLAYGFRNSEKDSHAIDHQFAKLHLEQRLLGLQVRFRGETDLVDNALTPGEDDRSNVSLQWYGSPLARLNWTAMNALYNYGGNAYWRIFQRANYQISERSTLWAHFSNQQSAYRGSYLNIQSYDLDYRWKKSDAIALQLLAEGSKVNPLSGVPEHHWRGYFTGLHWRLGHRRSALGVLQLGFKETYQFGSGVDIRFELEERIPLMESRKLRIGLSDHAEGELFFGVDDISPDPLYDLDHHLDLTVDLWPGNPIQLANTFRVLNHFGTDLAFSEDTLRNALTHNVQLKYIKRKLRASLDHLAIADLGDEGDLRLHLNSRVTYRLSSGTSLNLQSMYRYKSDLYPEYLWMNSFVKVHMRYFDWALELQAQGDPDTVFDENLSLWMRFVRQL